MNVNWAQVAPRQRPAGFNPSNPASPGYSWAAVDSAVRDLTARGLSMCLTLYAAPSWAEGAHRASWAELGSWRPSAKQFAHFATAAALRYDGVFPDPARPGSVLPRVRCWQAWNEPNIDFYLSPQWVKGQHRWKPVGARIYRHLLNSFYKAVKGVSRSNFVLMGGTAPFGLARARTPPVAFYRRLFCLNGRRALKPAHCPHAHLDGIDHHPFSAGGPTWHALNPDDVAVPDVHKISRVLRAGVRDGHVLPRGRKGLWVTEIAWSSNPPNPHGVPVATDARWYEEAMEVLWRQGVHTVMSLEIGDPPANGNFPGIFESGIYYHSGRPKLIAGAYKFPFVVQRMSSSRISVWGRSPARGKVKIEVLRKRHWKVLRTSFKGRRQVFSTSLRFRGLGTWRAQVGSQRSLTWKQGAPYTRR